MAVLAMVWFLALRGHSSSPGEQPAASTPASSSSHASTAASSSSPAGASANTAQSRSPGAPSKVYHGSVPGLEGLTRDINKAHGAVATSERNAAQLRRDSAGASGEAPQGTNGAHADASHAVSAASPSSVHTHAGPAAAPGRQHAGSSAARRSSRGARRHAGSGPSSHGSSGSKTTATNGRAPQQVEVEREISQGKTVLLLFWEPRSTVDNAVRQQVLALGKSSKGRLAVNVALANQVGLFGPVTEVAHVYETPTILIINRHGLVSTLTGLVDGFYLRQAVREAQHANR